MRTSSPSITWSDRLPQTSSILADLNVRAPVKRVVEPGHEISPQAKMEAPRRTTGITQMAQRRNRHAQLCANARAMAHNLPSIKWVHGWTFHRVSPVELRQILFKPVRLQVSWSQRSLFVRASPTAEQPLCPRYSAQRLTAAHSLPGTRVHSGSAQCVGWHAPSVPPPIPP